MSSPGCHELVYLTEILSCYESIFSENLNKIIVFISILIVTSFI